MDNHCQCQGQGQAEVEVETAYVWAFRSSQSIDRESRWLTPFPNPNLLMPDG
jgi:hypothetical protein